MNTHYDNSSRSPKAKAPAFQFYADDFIGGTVFLTTEDVGAYIRLLCFQWGNGRIPERRDQIDRIAGCIVSDDVLSKFHNGRNERMETERKKQEAYREQQAEKGRASARARFNHGSTTVQPSVVDIRLKPEGNSPSPSPSPKHERESDGAPEWNEVKAYAATLLLDEWKARDWFDEMEGCGWLDYQKRVIRNWKAVLNRVKTKWDGDGRPTKPPASKAYANGSTVKPQKTASPNI